MADIQPRKIESSTPKSDQRRRSQSTSSRGSQYECGCKRKGCHRSRKNEDFLNVPEKLNKTVEEIFGECTPKYHGCTCSDCLEKKKKDENSKRDPGIYDSPVKDKSVQQKVGDDSIIDKDIQAKISRISDKDIQTKKLMSFIFDKDIQTGKVKSNIFNKRIQTNITESLINYVELPQGSLKSRLPILVNYVTVSSQCICNSAKDSKVSNSATKTAEMKCYCEKCTCKSCPFTSESGGDKSKQSCKCGKCDCVNCSNAGEKDQKASGDPCTCPICQCKPCKDSNKKGGGVQTGTKQCSCPECKCNPCVDPDKSKAATKSSEPNKSTGECKCGNCTCKECQYSSTPPKVGGKAKDDNKCGCIMGCVCIKCKFMSSGKPPVVPLPCGGDMCKCEVCKCGLTDDENDGKAAPKKEDCKPEATAPTESKAPASCKCGSICLCKECEFGGSKDSGKGGTQGGIVTEASINCQCNPCTCAVCSKKGAGGGKVEGTLGCSCKNCTCPVCSKKGAASEKGGSQRGITTEASIGCKCNPCTCPVCSKKGAEGGKGEGTLGCSCKTCTCPKCPKMGATSEKSGSQGGITTEASIGCKCNPCTCPVCSKKGAGGGKGEGTLGCSCKNCTCPVCSKKGGSSEKGGSQGGITTEASIDCQCNPCSCPVCSKKGKKGAASEKDGGQGCKCGSACLCKECQFGGNKASGQGGIVTEASIGCECNPCTCPICSKKGKGDGGEKKSSGCTCKDCTCPVCPKKDAASGKDGSQGCKCGSVCLCKECQLGGNKASGKGGDQGGIVTKASIDCKCNPCTCAVCSKKGAGGGKGEGTLGCSCKNCTCPVCSKKGAASEKGGSQGGITTEASIDCKCNPCTCPICSKKGKGAASGKDGSQGCKCGSVCLCKECALGGNKASGKGGDQGGIVTEASIGCKCNPCTCPICSKKGKGDGGEKKSSGCTCKDCTCPVCSKKGAASGKDGNQGCKCGSVCLCKECALGGNKASGKGGDQGGIVTEASIDCKCNPCSCPVCSKKGKGGGKDSSGCTCSTCTCPVCPKKGADKEKGEGSLGCTCKTCTCPVCSKKGAASEKGGDQGGIVTEASIDCKCNPCSCPVCSKKGKGGGKDSSGCTCSTCTCPVCPKKGADKEKGEGSLGCTCKTCTCPVCSKKGAASEKGGDQGGIVTEASIDCKCNPCSCPVCSKKGKGGGKDSSGCTCSTCTCPVCPKKGADKGKGEGSLGCTCKTCTCPVCSKKGAASEKGGDQGGIITEASIGCKCNPCSCPICSKKGKGGGGEKDSSGCTCKTCTCPVCPKKSSGSNKEGLATEATITCQCNPCSCPICTKKGDGQKTNASSRPPCKCPPKSGGGAPAKPVCQCPKQGNGKGDTLKCNCQPNCTCPVCTKKQGGVGGDMAKSKQLCKCGDNCQCIDCLSKKAEKEASGGDKCLCKTCTCTECPKSGGAGAGSKSLCKCSNCTCINCTMKAPTKVYFCSTCTSDLPPSLAHITLGCPVEKDRNNSKSRRNSHNVHSHTVSPQKQGIGDMASKIERPDPKTKFVNEKDKCTKCCSIIKITDNRGKGDHLVSNPTVLREEVDYWGLVDGKEDPEGLSKKGVAHHKDRSKSKPIKIHRELSQDEMKEQKPKSKHGKSRSKHRVPQFDEEIDLSTVPPFEIPKKLTCNSKTCNCIICINKRAAKNSGTKSGTHSILKTKPEFKNVQKVYRSVGSRTTPTKELSKNNISPFEYISEKVCRDMTKKLLSELPKNSSKELRKSFAKEYFKELPKNYYLDYIKDQLKLYSKDRASKKCNKRPETMEDSSISQASQHGFEDVSLVEKPLVKHASEFNQTMSDLNLAFECLEKKGKVKDQLIEALSEALRNLGEDNSCETLMNLTLVGEAPDYDRTEEQKLLENCIHYRRGRMLSAPPYNRLKKTHRPTSANGNTHSKLSSDDSNLKEQQIQCIDYDTSSRELGESQSNENFSRPNEKLTYNVTCHHRDPFKQSIPMGDWVTGKKNVIDQLSKDKLSATSTLNSSEYDSKSSIQLAINNLQERCEAKDTLIKAAALELKKCISSNTLIKILNVIPEAMDISMGKNVKRGSKKKYQECKDTRIETPPKKTHAIVPSRNGKTAQVNLSGFEISNVTRVAFDSLMVKWSLLTNKAVCGYDVLVNGKEKAKIMSSTRTSTMIHSLDLSSSIFIAVYAVTSYGRLEPPATAIFELQTKIR